MSVPECDRSTIGTGRATVLSATDSKTRRISTMSGKVLRGLDTSAA